MTKTDAIILPSDYRYYWYEDIDSTNLEAFRKCQTAPRGRDGVSGSWFCARHQTGGRGSNGKEWESVDGNLHASLLTTTTCPPEHLSQVSILAALAAITAIEQLAPATLNIQDLCLKWPNDILLNHRKVCGVLVESRSSQKNGNNDIVIGTGINLEGSPGEGGLFRPGNLRQAGWKCSRGELFAALVRSTRDWFAIWRESLGFEELRLAWLEHSCHTGWQMQIKAGKERHAGRFTTLSKAGELVLERPDGTTENIASGHIVSIEPCCTEY